MEKEFQEKKKREEEKVEGLSKEFAAAIPGMVFSPAEIQGYLLKYKREPEKAVSGAEVWVKETMTEKRKQAEKERREEEERVKKEKEDEEKAAKEKEEKDKKEVEEKDTEAKKIVDEQKIADDKKDAEAKTIEEKKIEERKIMVNGVKDE